MIQTAYESRSFNLSGLNGISDATMEMHLGLYEGYVKNTNLLNERLTEMARKGEVSGKDPEYAEFTRRLGFEYGGMVLHEYYFDNLAPRGKGEPSAKLNRAFEESFGGFDHWREGFCAVGAMRGVGWAILYEDPVNGRLSNHWIALHQDGVPSGFRPIVVMDVWEHAYLLDQKPSDRSKYIDAFLGNMHWQKVNERLLGPTTER